MGAISGNDFRIEPGKKEWDYAARIPFYVRISN